MFGLDDAVAAGLRVLDKFIPDPALKAQAAKELQDDITKRVLAQLDINKAEIQTGSKLGMWRAGLGWAAASALVYNLILYPFMIAIILVFQPTFPVKSIPVIDMKQLGTILMGMLGISF